MTARQAIIAHWYGRESAFGQQGEVDSCYYCGALLTQWEGRYAKVTEDNEIIKVLTCSEC